MFMNTENNVTTGTTAHTFKMKIRPKKLNMMMCPAVMLAKRRIINEIGLINIPKISTGVKITNNHFGTPGIAKMCPQ